MLGCGGIESGACTNCATCPDGQHRAGCEGPKQGVCVACTHCPAGQYQTGCLDELGNNGGTCERCEACEDPNATRVGCTGADEGTCMTGMPKGMKR